MSETPNYQNVLVERRDAVGIITLNRPAALNALNAALIAELAAAVDDLENDEAVGAIVVGGFTNLSIAVFFLVSVLSTWNATEV